MEIVWISRKHAGHGWRHKVKKASRNWSFWPTEIIYDNKKLTPETKIKEFKAYFIACFPLQLQNLHNNTFSSRKNHLCIPAETLENLCTKRKMAKHRQKWGRIQKNRSHRMGQHHSKTNIEMVWESNQSRQINTSDEGV